VDVDVDVDVDVEVEVEVDVDVEVEVEVEMWMCVTIINWRIILEQEKSGRMSMLTKLHVDDICTWYWITSE
jgi:hypothetical protein